MLRFLKRLAADVPTPAADKVTLFVDTTGAAKLKNEAGTVTSVGGGISEALIDAAGDLIVGTAADTAGRLAKGAALQVLRVNAGATALEYADPSGSGSTVTASAGLSSHTPNNNTFEQWGTEEATIAQASAPSAAVVLAWLTGSAGFNAGIEGQRGEYKLEVSFDGGSTWADCGLAPRTSNATIVAGTRQPLATSGRITGTVTGDIQVRAMVRDVDTVNTISFIAGMIVVMVHAQ